MRMTAKREKEKESSVTKEETASTLLPATNEYSARGHSIVSAKPLYTHVSAVIDNRIDLEQFTSTLSVIVDDELRRFHDALQHSLETLELLALKLQTANNRIEADVVSSQIALITDPVFKAAIENSIQTRGQRVEHAVTHAMFHLRHAFSSIPDHRFCERYDNIEDVCCRILASLSRKRRKKEVELLHKLVKEAKQPGIGAVIAFSLVPSVASELTFSGVHAVVTCQGGAMSHTAVVCRSKGIPYISGISDEILANVKVGDPILIQSREGIVTLCPSLKRLNSCLAQQIPSRLHTQPPLIATSNSYLSHKNSGSDSTENIVLHEEKNYFQIMATVSNREEIDCANRLNLAGIGLYRSEYLAFQKKSIPSFLEQEQEYIQLVTAAQGKPIVFRTFDFSSDKSDEHLEEFIPKLAQEEQRNIPLVFADPTILQDQLFAIFSASQKGDVSILFPMVSSVNDLKRYYHVYNEAWNQYEQLASSTHTSYFSSHVALLKKPKIGAMVELPLAAVAISSFAGLVDFISVGTNDLIQYALAVDRSSILSLSQRETSLFAHVGFLHILKYIVQQAKDCNIPLTLCGELAADRFFLPVLVGIGIYCFSVPPRQAKDIVSDLKNMQKQAAEELSKKVLKCTSSKRVVQIIKDFFKKNCM